MQANEIIVDGSPVRFYSREDSDYLCITDIAKRFDSGVASIESWMRNRNTVEFLGTWERLFNPDFNSVGFDGIKTNIGLNTFKISVKRWIEQTAAIGLQARAGKYGGTYAHKDIAIQYCYWLSPTFQLFLIKEFQRLKADESRREGEKLEWTVKRMLSKANYLIHTDAVKEHLVPPRVLNTRLEGPYYASEADLLNLALFGLTARQWREANPEARGNVRDHAGTEQLLVLANLENLNAEFIKQGLGRDERLQRLNEVAIYQMQLLVNAPVLRQLDASAAGKQ